VNCGTRQRARVQRVGSRASLVAAVSTAERMLVLWLIFAMGAAATATAAAVGLAQSLGIPRGLLTLSPQKMA